MRLIVQVLFVNSIVCLFVYSLFCFVPVFVFEFFGWGRLSARCSGWVGGSLPDVVLFGEFDPGSGRTLAACLTHASRTRICGSRIRPSEAEDSGGRVSNA